MDLAPQKKLRVFNARQVARPCRLGMVRRRVPLPARRVPFLKEGCQIPTRRVPNLVRRVTLVEPRRYPLSGLRRRYDLSWPRTDYSV